MKNKILVVMMVLIVSLCVSTAYADTNSADSTSEAGAISQTLIDGSFNTDSSRGFVVPGNPMYGPVIPYYGKPEPSEAVQPAEQVLTYTCYFTEGALRSILRGVEDAEAEFKVVMVVPEDAEYNVRSDGQRWIKVILEVGAVPDTMFVGFVTARSKHEETTSVEVIAKAALKSLLKGCNVLQITAEGAVRDAIASGWGIGFNTTQAFIYDAQARSNVSSGGFGYSKAKAGMRDKPWYQGFGLIDPDLIYPEQ